MNYTFSPDVLALNPGLQGQATGKPSKYRNVPTEVDGHRFASKKEATHYLQLRLLLDAGQICNLILQPRFTLQEAGDGMRAVTYVADFMWDDLYTKRTHVLDSKGVKTKEFRIKEKLFRAKYPQYAYEVR